MIEKVYILKAGYCTHPEIITIKGGSFCNCEFPAIFVLIKHKNLGYILFDTGYSKEFFEASEEFPLSLYPKITPVFFKQEESAIAQLNNLGIQAEEIKYIIISHFHGDHISGLSSFSEAKYIYLEKAYNSVKYLQGFRALKAGFLPKLIPIDFVLRSIQLKETNLQSISTEYKPFEIGIDLFEDQSIIIVELPGHAKGQIGVFLKTQEQGLIFLIADASWSSKAFEELKMPHPITNILCMNPTTFKVSLFPNIDMA